MNVIPFQPTDGANVTRSATTTSANVQVISGAPQGRIQVRLVNDGTTVAFVKFGSDNTVTATSADIPLVGGVPLIVSVDIPVGGVLWLAAKMASGTANVYAQPGVGIS